MGKRYGRNQKRQHREERARLAKEIERLGFVATKHWEAAGRERSRRQGVERDLVDWADRIITLLGRESAFAREIASHLIDEATFIEVAEAGRPYRVQPPRSLSSLGPSTESVVLLDASTVIELFATSAEPRDLGDRYRFEVRRPDGRAVLLADKRTIADLMQRGDAQLIEYLLAKLIRPWFKGEI
ncbi:MAG: hypothetical protein Tp170SUR191951_35 [Prokaryotic dsDNA virus sp.]|nr:hypothetical protein [Pseudomonas sp.]MBS67334.1 hypothetical protein [Pseudomonas sp.]QDP55197.1 MAG: hypothetical protein Tp170SUR191951_35 [Prokaryotic dsDNA virus sp.]|tara:strand:- start:3510 stop:4064 length:555 start_codon:yes stop_codon:yes gene_type:complete